MLRCLWSRRFLFWKWIRKHPQHFLWFWILVYTQSLLPFGVVSRCRTPKDSHTNILLIADPQLTDPYSYKQSGVSLALTQFYSDVYMKQNYAILLYKHKPDAVFFIGDLMDGGRGWDNTSFYKELERFNWIFPPRHASPRLYYMAGNHDIGISKTIIPLAYDRFKDAYGPFNYVVTFGKTVIIALDTVSLSAPKESRYHEASRQFLTSLTNYFVTPEYTRILLTHIPLYRPDHSDCGPARRHPPIHAGAGYQYENLVAEPLSKEILETLQPSLILSGDDHDDCVYTHQHSKGSSLEHTLSTFSWLQGNLYPGYGLLSLGPTIDGKAPEYTLQACPLSAQMIVYFIYIGFFLATILWVWMSSNTMVRSQDAEYIRLPRYQSESDLPTVISSNHRMDFWTRLKRVIKRMGSIVLFVMGLHYFLMIFI